MIWSVPVGAWTGQAAFILGGGPSLKGFDVERLRGRGRVIAVNNAGLDLATWADVLYFADGQTRWYGWNKDRLHLFQGELIVSRSNVNDPRVKYIERDRFYPLSRNPRKISGFCGGSNAINLAYLFGANPIILLGFDMRPGNWHNLHKLPPMDGQHRNKFIPALEAMAPELERDGVLVLNTNPRSALRCFPFADIEELLMLDDLAKIEAEKYRRVWEREGYRRVSPGMHEVERAWLVCEMWNGKTLIDYGAGPCRAAKWFQDKGLSVLAIDIADNAREHDDVPFVKACLWDLPREIPASDYAFCTDVMEHIPPAHVATVLNEIAARTTIAAYFRIATRPDRMGPKLIGRPLHLSVNSGEWWRRQIERVFPLVDVIQNTGRDIILLARP